MCSDRHLYELKTNRTVPLSPQLVPLINRGAPYLWSPTKDLSRISPSSDLHVSVPVEYFYTPSTESPFCGSDLVDTPSKRTPPLSRFNFDLT